MNQIRQYRPAFFEGFEEETVPFNTTEELVQIPFVKRHQEVGGGEFQVTKHGRGYALMIVRPDQWFVVGFMPTLEGVNLPHWSPPPPPCAIERKTEKA
jgi:hypothetical protein